MRRSINILIGVLVVLIVVLLLLGGFEVWEELYKPD
jgi:TRAP-type C4-dicarboxylate transport system permease small subunit